MLPIDIQNRIRKKLKHIEVHPTPLQEAIKLKGYSNLYRFRVQEYRIIFELQQYDIILILVKHRKDIYKLY